VRFVAGQVVTREAIRVHHRGGRETPARGDRPARRGERGVRRKREAIDVRVVTSEAREREASARRSTSEMIDVRS
jgi:hypothetical protein